MFPHGKVDFLRFQRFRSVWKLICVFFTGETIWLKAWRVIQFIAFVDSVLQSAHSNGFLRHSVLREYHWTKRFKPNCSDYCNWFRIWPNWNLFFFYIVSFLIIDYFGMALTQMIRLLKVASFVEQHFTDHFYLYYIHRWVFYRFVFFFFIFLDFFKCFFSIICWNVEFCGIFICSLLCGSFFILLT